MSKQTTIIVRTKFAGVHMYPEAPDGVEFLRTPHRHIFDVEAEIGVDHNDRELEFILVKKEIDSIVEGLRLHSNGEDTSPHWYMGRLSCEDVANLIGDGLGSLYGRHRTISVAVFEDGENGAKVCYRPDNEGGQQWT